MSKPIIVTVGSLKLPIYSTPTGDRERFTLAWYEAGKRKRKVFENLADAKSHANAVAVKLANGQIAALELSTADHESYVIAMRELPPGVPLHEAVRQYAAAFAALPPGGTLLEAAKALALRRVGDANRRTVTAVVEEYIALVEAEQEKGELSLRHVQTLRSHLRRFATRFQTALPDVQTDDINTWLRHVAPSRKTWNNIRTSLVALFRWARDKKYLPQEVQTAADKTKRKKVGDCDIGILKPDELQKLLAAADDEARLYLALGAFTGIRTAELVRMDWSHVRFELGNIHLDRTVTKTKGKRIIPILPNLETWLTPFRNNEGKIFSSEKATDRTIAFAKEKGIDWPSNALRHSFASYRTAQTKSHPQVALEMGNSVAMVKRHYDGTVSEQDAQAWFAIAPVKPANVVSMKGAA